MPIIIPSGSDHLAKRLEAVHAATISEDSAERQDMRPARIGILNLMPAGSMEKTEIQWLKYISHTFLQIDHAMIKFDDDFREREGASRRKFLAHYTAFSKIAEIGLDGLIITGDNIELNDPENPEDGLLDFEKVRYAEQLAEVVTWAHKNVYSTVYSCWASHFALNHLFGLPREQRIPKIFGVYTHDLIDTDSVVTAGMDDTIAAPHSRWGDIPTRLLGKVGVRPLAVSDEAGWLLAQTPNNSGGTDLFIQGHPEYDRYDLHNEYVRDQARGQSPPVGYYNEVTGEPVLGWANGGRTVHSNWITSLYNNFANQ